MTRQDSNRAFMDTEFLHGVNGAYVEALQAKFDKDPSSVEPSWRDFFEALGDDPESKVTFAGDDNHLFFQFGPRLLITRKLTGNFPDYERVIPRGNDKVLRVNQKDFSAAVSRVSAISSERHRPVKLSLARDLLVISAASPEQGTASEELDADRIKYESGPLEIGFQARYLNDVTEQIEGDVEFVFADGAAPTLVRDPNDLRAVYVLMPMRV